MLLYGNELELLKILLFPFLRALEFEQWVPFQSWRYVNKERYDKLRVIF